MWVTRQSISGDYLTRFFLVPNNRYRNFYLHVYTGSDDDRALHDHPWDSVSFLLWGNLVEVTSVDHEDGIFYKERIMPLLPFFRDAEYSHRLELRSKFAVTIFITKKKRRKWGFWCGKRWVFWKDFVDKETGGLGKGCG